jgi:Rrf2 family protein
MKLTTKSEYSLLALIYMARNYKTDYVKIEAICRHYEIPQKYLEQLFNILKANKLVKAKRGSNGGYALMMSPDKISAAQIIRLFDGALAPIESVSKYFFAPTPLDKEKKIIGVMKDIRDYISQKMENLYLSDLI